MKKKEGLSYCQGRGGIELTGESQASGEGGRFLRPFQTEHRSTGKNTEIEEELIAREGGITARGRN